MASARAGRLKSRPHKDWLLCESSLISCGRITSPTQTKNMIGNGTLRSSSTQPETLTQIVAALSSSLLINAPPLAAARLRR